MAGTGRGYWLGLLVTAGVTAGCGSGSAPPPDESENSRKILEMSLEQDAEARREHIIGFDTTGLPVYGVDDEGKPITNRKEKRQMDEEHPLPE